MGCGCGGQSNRYDGTPREPRPGRQAASQQGPANPASGLPKVFQPKPRVNGPPPR